jgi:hypothetical protein
MTPRQVAEHFNVPIGRVYQAIRDGRIKAEKLEWGLLIHKNMLPYKWPGRRGR